MTGAVPARPPRIGVSSCLLGQAVRYDGGHKRDRFLTDTLGPFVEWVPVCPEAEAGFGTPREPMRLVGDPDAPRLVTRDTGRDLTTALSAFAERRARALGEADLDGYVLKADSPSCGLERVKVYGPSGMPRKAGQGLFARALTARLPWLPVEEEGRLCDPGLREHFVERVFAHARWRGLVDEGVTVGHLVAFHAAHKYQLLAHDPEGYRALGRLVARAKALSRGDLARAYGEGFFGALGVRATPAKHANVLQHLLGFAKDVTDAADRAEVLVAVRDFRAGLLPLVVPLTLLRHHLRRAGAAWATGQTYLDPHPRELLLRNHA